MRKLGYVIATGLVIITVSFWVRQAAAQPGEGYANRVLEVTEQGSPISVRTGVGDQFAEVEKLLWGDRFLWLGYETTLGGVTWREVIVGNGRRGWIVNVPGATFEPNPFYTTPGYAPGVFMRVVPEGDGATVRETPSTYSERLKRATTGDVYQIIGGPYQAEYQMWWNVRTAEGIEGWIIDIPDWTVVSGSP